MRVFGAILLVTLALPAAWAKVPQVTSIEVQQYGIFTSGAQAAAKPAQQAAPTTTPQTPAAPIPSTAVSGLQLVTQTRTIPMRTGVQFGFQYIARGRPKFGKATLHFVIVYPSPGLRKPGASSPILRDEYDQAVYIDDPGSFHGYKLANDWELAPGDWTFEIWNGQTKLASQTFTLVKP